MKTTPPNAKAPVHVHKTASRLYQTADHVRHRRPGRPTDKPHRAVLFGYLLRTAAQHPDSSLADRATQVVDRLELHALESLIPLLDPTETRLMAHLMLASTRRTRMRGLSRGALCVLVGAADDAVGLAFLTELSPDERRPIVAGLGPKRATFEKALAPPRAPTVWDALRLRRLFTR